MLVLVKCFSYIPHASFNEVFLLLHASSSEVFDYIPHASFSEVFLLHPHASFNEVFLLQS